MKSILLKIRVAENPNYYSINIQILIVTKSHFLYQIVCKKTILQELQKKA